MYAAREAERLNELGLADVSGLELAETRVERVGDRSASPMSSRSVLTAARSLTEPFTGYE